MKNESHNKPNMEQPAMLRGVNVAASEPHAEATRASWSRGGAGWREPCAEARQAAAGRAEEGRSGGQTGRCGQKVESHKTKTNFNGVVQL